MINEGWCSFTLHIRLRAGCGTRITVGQCTNAECVSLNHFGHSGDGHGGTFFQVYRFCPWCYRILEGNRPRTNSIRQGTDMGSLIACYTSGVLNRAICLQTTGFCICNISGGCGCCTTGTFTAGNGGRQNNSKGKHFHINGFHDIIFCIEWKIVPKIVASRIVRRNTISLLFANISSEDNL